MEVISENKSMMLVDIQYVRGSKQEGTTDCLYIIWKDLANKEKYLQVVPEPEMDIYFEKPQYRNHLYCKCDAPIDTLDKRRVKYKNIIYEIANEMGSKGKAMLSEIYESRSYRRLQEFFLYPYVFAADFDVRSFYRIKWLESYDNDEPKPITKGYLDIEVDIMESSNPDPIYDPIDLVTLIDNDTRTSYTFALTGVSCPTKDTTKMSEEEKKEYEKKLKMYQHRKDEQEYWSSHIDELQKQAHEKFDENYPDFSYEFYFYTDERQMLVHLFQLINKLKLDFIEIWNISFDIPFIINRCKVLGLDPKEVICHPDFPVKECWFKEDNHNFMVKNKSHFFHCSSYTIYTDQMVNYAAIRKGGGELRSYKLTYVGQKEIGDEKLDYSEVANIKTLSYTDYLMYILYNIKDVLLQYGIENKTSDLDTYYITSYANATPYESIFKQTVKLRNVQYMAFLEQGLIPGNNINSILNSDQQKSENDEEEEEEDEKVKFEGALVGNPLLIDNFGMELYGKKTSNIFQYSIDFDMSRFYPSCIGVMNIYPKALIFKVIMAAEQFKSRGGDLPYHGITDIQLVDGQEDSFKDDVAKEVMDNFQTKNYLSFGKKWFNLPSVNEVYEYLMETIEEE